MTVRLTGSGIRPTVEKPKARGRLINQCKGAPIVNGQPAGLRLPGLGDQQHVGDLNREFVQNHHMRIVDPLNFKTSIPGEKWIRFGACGTQVFWCCAEEMPQLEAALTVTCQVCE